MAHTSAVPTIEYLTLSQSDSDTEGLFASPTRTAKKPAPKNLPEPSDPNTPDNLSRELASNPNLDDEEVREAALRRELAGIRSINEVIEGVVASLERAKGNVDVGLLVSNSFPQKSMHSS